MVSRGTDLTIVIPAYNEERRLPRMLQQLESFVAAESRVIEVVVVNDGSVDSGQAILSAFSQGRSWFRYHHASENHGKGAAVARGVLMADGAHVVFMDADLSVPIERVADLMVKLAEGYDAAIGVRIEGDDRNPIRRGARRGFMGRVFRGICRALLLPGILDSQCGFKAFKRDAAVKLFSGLKERGYLFDVEILRTALNNDMSVAQVPVPYSDEPDSKVRWYHAVQMFVGLMSMAARAPRRLLGVALLLWLVLMPGPAWAQVRWAPSAVELKPVISDTTVIVTCYLENVGGEPVRLRSLEGSCDCMEVLDIPAVLPAGRRIRVRVRILLDALDGWERKELVAKVHGSASPLTLPLTLYVPPFVSIQPRYAFWPRGVEAGDRRVRIRVLSDSVTSLQLINSGAGDKFMMRLMPGGAERTYELILSPPATGRPARAVAVIRATLVGGRIRDIRIPVSAE